MTATVQAPTTPEFFEKVEKRLGVLINEEVKERASHEERVKQYQREGLSVQPLCSYFYGGAVREFRGIRDALKSGLTVNLDASTYWSLCNE
jgi:hypothetical protein